MAPHAIGLGLGGVAAVLGLFVIYFSARRRQRRKRQAAVDEALALLRRTGILLKLAPQEPNEIKRLQERLREWGYEGEIDGQPGEKMIAAIENLADAKGVDLDAEALNQYVSSPGAIQHEVVLQTARQRLSEDRLHRLA